MARAALLHSHSSPAPQNPPDPLVTPSHGCLPQAVRPPPEDASLAKGLGSSSEVSLCPFPCPFPAAGLSTLGSSHPAPLPRLRSGSQSQRASLAGIVFLCFPLEVMIYGGSSSSCVVVCYINF